MKYSFIPHTVTARKPMEPNYGRFIDNLKSYAHGIKVRKTPPSLIMGSSTPQYSIYRTVDTPSKKHRLINANRFSDVSATRTGNGLCRGRINNIHQVVCVRWPRSRRLLLGRQEYESQSPRLHHSVSGGLCRRVSRRRQQRMRAPSTR